MKVLLSWLREFIDLQEPVEKIADSLTIAGIEVDAIETVASPEGGNDTLFDLAITPNLGHCQSIMGIARELSAIMEKPLIHSPWRGAKALLPSSTWQTTPHHIDIRTEGCGHYSTLSIGGLVNAPSPAWLKERLELCGMRSIHPIVDVTNYVMHEYGQPLHAFDASCIQGTLSVREGTPSDKITLLDGAVCDKIEHMVVIADSVQPLALGGVMGGASSSISPDTTEILLESAFFTPTAARKTARTLKLHTESAKHFERGTDPNITRAALERAYELLQRIFPNMTVRGGSDWQRHAFEDKRIECRRSYTSAVLGFEVSVHEMEAVFRRLQFPAEWDGQDQLRVSVPFYRHDVQEEVDLVEEVGRLLGLQQQSEKPIRYVGSPIAHHPLFVFERAVRSCLVASGLQECLTCNLISPKLAQIVTHHAVSEASLVHVCNPMSQEQSVLRPSLLPGLLSVLKENVAHRMLDLSCFELGHVHLKRDGEKATTFQEQLVAGLLLSGQAMPPHFSGGAREVDFFDLKGIIENVLDSLGCEVCRMERASLALFHPGRQAKIYSGSVHVGMMGELHPALLRQWDIPQRALFAEIDLSVLEAHPRGTRAFQELALFPASERDWTVTVPLGAIFEEIAAATWSWAPAFLEQVTLRATYRGQGQEGQKQKGQNITLRFVYRDRERTLSQGEVDTAHEALVANVSKFLNEKRAVYEETCG